MTKYKFLALLFLSLNLTSCATVSTDQKNLPANLPEVVTPTEDVEATPAEPKDQNTLKTYNVSNVSSGNPMFGGTIERLMMPEDRVRAGKAMDKAPGTETKWTNKQTGISYIVLPIKALVIEKNPFCREYQVTYMQHDASNSITGTACIADDGTWHRL